MCFYSCESDDVEKLNIEFCSYVNVENFDKTILVVNKFLDGLSNNLSDEQKIQALTTWLKSCPCIIDATILCVSCIKTLPAQSAIIITFMRDGVVKDIVFGISMSNPLTFAGYHEHYTSTSSKEDSLSMEIKAAEELYEELEAAFQFSSTNALEQFLNDWNESVPSNSAKSLEQKEIYDIYKEFYTPFNLLRLGNWQWGNSLNSNSKYVAIQNYIEFAIIKEEFFDIWFRSDIYESINFEMIEDFRPSLNLAKNQILYLLPEYAEAFNMFLKTEPFGTDNVYTEDVRKKYEFIRPYIPVLQGHWGYHWHIATHPEINRIFMNPERTRAKIDFRVGYQGGEAIFTKHAASKWIITESKATWIE